MPAIVCLGEAVIDLFAPTGISLKEAERFSRAAGGGPANTAVCLARMGRDVGLIGCVGADAFGEYLIDLIAAEGVDTTHFRPLDGELTTTVLVASPTPDRQDFTIFRGADAQLQSEHLDDEYIATAAVFTYGSTIFTGPSRQAGRDAVSLAGASGVLVAFDANLRPRLWTDMEAAREGIMEGVRTCDICKLNEIELEFLAGITDPAAGIAWVLEQGPALAALTLGADGVWFGNAQACGHVPAFDVEEVDTTGCGDAFVAGLAAGVVNALRAPPSASGGRRAALESCPGDTLRDMFRFANAVGAVTATAVGAMSALPTREQVEGLLQR